MASRVKFATAGYSTAFIAKRKRLQAAKANGKLKLQAATTKKQLKRLNQFRGDLLIPVAASYLISAFKVLSELTISLSEGRVQATTCTLTHGEGCLVAPPCLIHPQSLLLDNLPPWES